MTKTCLGLLTRTLTRRGWTLAVVASAATVIASSCVEGEKNDACLFWDAGATLKVSEVATGTKLPIDEGIELSLEAGITANGESYTATVSFELTAERYRLVVTPGTEVRVGGELLTPEPACGDGDAYTVTPSGAVTTDVTVTSLEPIIFVVISPFFTPGEGSNENSSSGSSGSSGDADFDFD